MKKLSLSVLLALILFASSGCGVKGTYNEVVKESYIHTYGVAIAKSDWENQGKEGTIVQLRRDGVTVTTPYVGGLREGACTYSFPNSSVVHRIDFYQADQWVGKQENYLSGVPMQEERLEADGSMHLTRWYEEGTPQAVEVYREGLLVSGEYFTLTHQVELQLQDGEGVRVCRSGTGELLSRDTIRAGEMIERTTYFSNGDPATVTPFVKGKAHGMRSTFERGGVPATVESWVHGIQEGVTTVYRNGEKSAEVPYIQGKKEGVERRYRAGNEHLLAEEISWHQDVQHGEHRFFVDGDSKSDWYHQGELVSRTAYERMNLPGHPATRGRLS